MRLAGAVDIGGTSTKIGVVAEDGSIVRRGRVPTGLGGQPAPLVDAIASSLLPILKELDTGNAVSGVGVSVAGFLDRGHSMMQHNANLLALRDFPLRQALEERLSLECRLEVDSNAACVAEYRHGAGVGSRRLLGVTAGTGLGGAVIIDDQLLRYTGECAGDLGHIIVDPNGRMCTCGARGCLEAMVNSASLSERAQGRAVRDIVDSAREGDELSRKALAETGHWLGLGLASLSPIFSPDKIVVGGGIAAAGDLLLDSVRASYRKHARPEFS
ncbi:MAG: ROK family protein, partial [Gemmatimonadales bacterium]